MRESKSSPNLVHLTSNSSIRLRKRKNEVNKKFLESRRSGDFGYSQNNSAVHITNDGQSVDTLDPGPASAGIQHNLRPLLRKKYREYPLSDREEDMGRQWGEGRGRRADQARGVKITDFGMIDQPPVEIYLNDER